MKKPFFSLLLILLVSFAAAQHQRKHSAIKNLSSGNVKSGYYYIKCSADGNYMDLPGPSTEAQKKNTHIQLWDMDDGYDRIIHIRRLRSGWYTMQPMHSPYAFDIEGGAGATHNGAKLQLWDNVKESGLNSSVNSHFRFKEAPGKGTYYIKVRHSGKYLDAVDGDLYKNGCAIQQWDFHGKKDQRWILEPYKGKVYKLYEGTE
ncbi:MAG: RICIN domain-containing protein [Bacteroidales bacterium]|nr:RICIN domain-containing protein [Bacteroidales bacterium]MCF8336763.1 RICIN domain-containing protein [Bacteroidales bacterium]